MATEKPASKRKGGGGKLERSETVTVRLDPQLHYLAGLAARKHRRTLSSFIEWAVKNSFEDVEMYHGSGYNGDDSETLKDVESRLWDVDPAERFARLAILYPDLLTHEEQERWKMLMDSQILSVAARRQNDQRIWNWSILEDATFPVLRQHWDGLLDAHAGGPDTARQWVTDMQAKVATGKIYKNGKPVFEEVIDEIPF